MTISQKRLAVEHALRHRKHLGEAESLEDWVRVRRNGESGYLSWRKLAELITELSGIKVTDMGLRWWFQDTTLFPPATGYGINE